MNHIVMLIACPDKRGITAAVTNFVYEMDCNIVHADQHIDEQSNTFFMRIEFSISNKSIDEDSIRAKFADIKSEFNMKVEYCKKGQKLKTAIFVSKHLHCLADLLARENTCELNTQTVLIISNHQDAASLAKKFGIEFEYIPISNDNKNKQEGVQLKLLNDHHVELIVLARYHQILSEDFVSHYAGRMINIHHSFLPAFVGQKPYHRAFEKGVKIIGATSHYVTKDLDEGPIIEQDTVRVTHRDSINDMIHKGRDLERNVLARAINWHLDKKILSYGNKTVVFD